MYLSYEDYLAAQLGGIPSNEDTEVPKPQLDEAGYISAAPIADAIIDDWTLGRVGKAVANGEALPAIVQTVYFAICNSVPGLMEGSKVGNSPISSFSNGIDSYGFAVTSEVSKQLRDSIGWMVELLPVEWCSACVSFEGGNRYAG